MKFKLGFYSHIPLAQVNGRLYMPAFIGKYIDEMASRCETLMLFSHTENYSVSMHDYQLKANAISLIDLGKKQKALIRFLFGFIYLLPVLKNIKLINHIIVRTPTPLSHWFKLIIPDKKLSYLIVADDKQGAEAIKLKSIRSCILKIFLLISDLLLKASIKNTKSFANSVYLYNKYTKHNKNMRIVSTSNLQRKDFVDSLNYQINDPIKLLYVGRVDLNKGIIETLYAIKKLLNSGIDCSYDIVGWDDTGGKNVKYLTGLAKQLGVFANIKLHGKIKYGKSLNEFYRRSDICIIVSYHESFPRTIYESMANSTLVIASNVGSIPYQITNHVNSIIINPMSVIDIEESILLVIQNFELRKKIISNAYKLSKQFNIIQSVRTLLEFIDER